MKASKFYEQVAKAARKAGISEAVLERRVKYACNYLNSVDEVKALLDEMTECAKIKIFTKNSKKPLKINLDHLCLFEVKDGRLKGGHIDFMGKLQQAGKLKYHIIQEGPDGIWRAFISYDKLPGKESSFFPREMKPSEVLNLLKKLLEKIDISKELAEGASNIRMQLDCGNNWDIEIFINKKSFEILSFYPIYKGWKDPLQKILYARKK